MSTDPAPAAQPPVDDVLIAASIEHALDPGEDLAMDDTPDPTAAWMPEHMISLYGTPHYAALSAEQRGHLARLEISVLFSVSCYGEKEVIANLTRRIMGSAFARHRRYLHHFLKEEHNHILMFADFCERYGHFFPLIFPYARGSLWEDPGVDCLMTLFEVLFFEEVGAVYNYELMRAKDIPPLVRAINRYHWLDESRHLAFGREAIARLAAEVIPALDTLGHSAIHEHVASYVNRVHYDFHCLKAYQMVGIREAFVVRDELVTTRGVQFFMRTPWACKRIQSALAFLEECGLLPSGHGLGGDHAVGTA